MTLKIVGCLSISTIGRRCVTIKRFAYMFTWSIIGERCVTLKIVSCLSMSNIWKRFVTIKGIGVHVERRNKFPRQLIPPLSKNSIDSSIPSMSYVMQPSIGKMKKSFLINYFLIHNASEVIM